MRLSELNIGDEAEIIAISSSEELKKRLASFGVIRGSSLIVEAYSPAKKTIEIIVDGTHIGLRSSEAEMIEVKSI